VKNSSQKFQFIATKPRRVQSSIPQVPGPGQFWRVVAGRSSGIKSWGGTLGSLAVIYVAAVSHTVRGESGRLPATNQGPSKI